jgi:hypothetical protein
VPGDRLVDVATGRQLAWFKRKTRLFPDALLSPDGRRVLSLEGPGPFRTRLVLWDVATGDKTAPPGPDLDLDLFGERLSPDGRKVLVRINTPHTGLEGLGMGLVDVASAKVEWQVHWMLEAGTFSPDGKEVAAAVSVVDHSSEGYLVRWEAATGRQLWRVPRKTGAEHPAVFSADGRRFLDTAYYLGRRGEPWLRLWDSAAGRLLHEWSAEQERNEALERSLFQMYGPRRQKGDPP